MAQLWQARRYAEQCGFVAELGMPVLDLLAARPGERILDLGCGDGVLTAKLVERGAAVVGVDASPDMVAAARARGLDARVMDGAALSFDRPFDAVFSNAALHWMKRPDEVIAGVARALRPGGRFVGEFGGFGNVAAIRVALYAALAQRGIDAARLDPWYFPAPADYQARLERRGFGVRKMELLPRPTPLPTGLADWFGNFGGTFLAALPDREHPALLAELADMLAPALRDTEGRWTADYVRLRFAAELPA